VRHAPVVLDLARPSREWRLSEEGRAAAERLARSPLWRDVTAVFTSPEPKAVDTARPIADAAGIGVEAIDGLREADRGPLPVRARDDYEALVERYLAGDTPAGWEPPDAVRRRVGDAINGLRARADGPVAIVSHGLALSLHLGLSVDEWRQIALPAVAVDRPPFLRVDEFLARG
jgi:broad specificity phosphatase PhoE